MSDELSEAINVVMFEVTTMLVDSGLPVPDSLVIVTEAARRWADLTSEETIEQAADLVDGAFDLGPVTSRIVVDFVLRAVAEGSGE